VPTQALIWTTAGQLFATPAECVVEVLPPVRCDAIKDPPDFLRGTLMHRGTRLAVLDAPKLFGMPSDPERMSNRVLVLKAGSSNVGVWVASVLDLQPADSASAQIQTPWGLAERAEPKLLIGPDRLAVIGLLLREVAA